MRVEKGNLFSAATFMRAKKGGGIVITTNGQVRRDGRAVMGRGVALQAAQKWSTLPALLGDILPLEGNHSNLFFLDELNVITLPTKEHWKDPSPLWLIERSLGELIDITAYHELTGEVFLPPIGCGNGGRNFKTEIKPLLNKYLDNRYVVLFP